MICGFVQRLSCFRGLLLQISQNLTTFPSQRVSVIPLEASKSRHTAEFPVCINSKKVRSCSLPDLISPLSSPGPLRQPHKQSGFSSQRVDIHILHKLSLLLLIFPGGSTARPLFLTAPHCHLIPKHCGRVTKEPCGIVILCLLICGVAQL